MCHHRSPAPPDRPGREFGVPAECPAGRRMTSRPGPERSPVGDPCRSEMKGMRFPFNHGTMIGQFQIPKFDRAMDREPHFAQLA